MIWVRGAIVADTELKISVLDRTFEHGLGLFETLRTWNGHATLLPRHLARMTRSAAELRVPLDPADLPDAEAVANLLEADGQPGDAMLRITVSGGLSETEGSIIWMRSAPLPPPAGSYRLGPPWNPGYGDELAACKSLNYWSRRRAYENARAEGFDEVLVMTSDLSLREGSRTNLFTIKDGVLTTPSAERPGHEPFLSQYLERPIVPGIMRGVVLERAALLGLERRESRISLSELEDADEVFLTNSVRGIIPVQHWAGRDVPAPGPITRRLWHETLAWLEAAGPHRP